MGPRSCDRGKRFASVGKATGLMLQWGRGRVTAESRNPRRNRSTNVFEASMGPRSCDRGKSAFVTAYAVTIADKVCERLSRLARQHN